MRSSISDEQIDGMLVRAKRITEEDGGELTEEHIRSNIGETNPCGSSYLDQCWDHETDGVRDATDRETYGTEMTERVIERFRTIFPAA